RSFLLPDKYVRLPLVPGCEPRLSPRDRLRRRDGCAEGPLLPDRSSRLPASLLDSGRRAQVIFAKRWSLSFSRRRAQRFSEHNSLLMPITNTESEYQSYQGVLG